MKQETILKGMFVGGVIGILLGVMFIAIGVTLPPPVSTIYVIFGLIVAAFSGVFTLRVKKEINKVLKKSLGTGTKALAIALVVFTLTVSFLNAAYAQSIAVRECIDMYRRIVYVEYVMIGFLIIAGFLAFAPVILGRTILGPILADLQYMAGAMLVLLIFALLLVFPLDAMFYVTPNLDQCEVRLDYLRDRGPFLLQIILKLLMPPQPPV